MRTAGRMAQFRILSTLTLSSFEGVTLHRFGIWWRPEEDRDLLGVFSFKRGFSDEAFTKGSVSEPFGAQNSSL